MATILDQFFPFLDFHQIFIKMTMYTYMCMMYVCEWQRCIFIWISSRLVPGDDQNSGKRVGADYAEADQ